MSDAAIRPTEPSARKCRLHTPLGPRPTEPSARKCRLHTPLGPRPAEARDLDLVSGLARRRPFAAGWSRSALSAELARADSLFMVARGGSGYVLARLVGSELRLLDLVAARDGHGTGRALWAAILDAGRKAGAGRLTLEVSAANVRALDFYAAAGARVVGRREKFYDDGSGAVLMDFDFA